MGHNYTEGKWEKIGSNLILTSDDTYKDRPGTISEVYVATSEVSAKDTKTKKKIKPTYTFNLDSVFLKGRSFTRGPNDTTYVYFQNVVFKISGYDTYGYVLCELDSSLIPTNSVFIKSGKLPNQVYSKR